MVRDLNAAMGLKFVPTEDEEQATFCRWLDLNQLLYYSIPNGGKRSITTACRLKKTGVKKGVPDMFICEPRGRYHGLYIEMKRKVGGALTPEQKVWIAKLLERGFYAAKAHGAGEAIEITERYLAGN